MDWYAIAILALAIGLIFATLEARRLRRDLKYLRELMDMRTDYRAKDYERCQEDIWALRRGMEANGMEYRPKAIHPATWVKKQ